MKKLILVLGLMIFYLVSHSQQQGTFKDSRDGKVYKTVKIDSVWFMAENLAYKPNSGKYWAVNNDQNTIKTYGYQYSWETANKVVPKGWHLPTKAEWEKLYKFLGDDKMLVYNNLLPGGISGFNALLVDDGGPYANFYGIGSHADFWSSTPYEENQAYAFGCGVNKGYAGLFKGFIDCSFYIRLIKDY
jgi:uncharacterized protein (TIGR02145 family)